MPNPPIRASSHRAALIRAGIRIGPPRTESTSIMRSYFFFQAEDGIRDGHVTGVQTCALPISQQSNLPMPKVAIIPTQTPNAMATGRNPQHAVIAVTQGILNLLTEDELRGVLRSEERRVGKECRAEVARCHDKNKQKRRAGQGG